MAKRTSLVMAAMAVATLASARPAQASNIILNGGFEAGLTSWVVVDEAAGSGAWFSQTGTTSPLNGFLVGAPPQGSFAAMTDQGGPGSHILYQDFVVPVGVSAATLDFQYFIDNAAATFFSPASLSYTTPQNQQARVDIITTTANVATSMISTARGERWVARKAPPSAPATAGTAVARRPARGSLSARL